MAFRILPGETVEHAIRRIAREEVDAAIAEVDDPRLTQHDAIHQVRKRCKKLRALIRLVRPAFDGYASENRRFRDAARSLSELRDATTLIECFEELVRRYRDRIDAGSAERIRHALLERRHALAGSLEVSGRLQAFRAEMVASRHRVEQWSFTKSGFAAISGGLRATYALTRTGMRRAYARPSVERFHEWRKAVKYNRHHAQLLYEIWEPVMQPLCDELKRLSELLGQEHDLAVMRAVLCDPTNAFVDPREVEHLLTLRDRRRDRLRARARPVAKRLYAEQPSLYVERIGVIREGWESEQKLG